ncbi:thioredoxin-like protein [Gymnopilus junonius]|uniref:Thioredoxin-like protein n=1 Tax=Gymnopilus junonius TaxID=109634 RepID=A0A9P5TI80_GYMJU|nr:thioredoxin-like protein [Gymnopilus junonius]
MFNSFNPELSIFHRRTSPQSTRTLDILKAAVSGPYPHTDPKNPALDFDLQVVERPPTADQLKVILSYLPSPATNPAMAFLSAHYTAPTATNAPVTVAGIAELAQKNPDVLKWPIVVDWLDGQAAVGDVDGVKKILERLRQKRDGEIKG